MSRRRRLVKIKSASRLFALALANLLHLLLASRASGQLQQLADHELLVAAEPFQTAPSPFTAIVEQPRPGARQLGQPMQATGVSRELAAVAAATASSAGSSQSLASLPSMEHLCSMLAPATARHLKLCKLISHSAGSDEAVVLGAARGLAECRNQFKAERWNCTHAHGDHHLLTGRLAQSVGNRESGFVQAIAAAGIVHSIATACSLGNLSDCACDKSRMGPIRQRDQNWKWGGCSNNIRHGMMFAKHLVELLDAIHQHARHLSGGEQWAAETAGHLLRQPGSGAAHNSRRHAERRLKRALSSGHREPNQLRAGPGRLAGGELLAAELRATLLSSCLQNQNLSQTTHFQLIKSLLARNSLEKHQDFRLAMNMHNNRIGRMAVARNMEIKCRCHGLSGSCSLKTCWLKLPDFQLIGAYLKRKYEASVHLPSAVNVNRLIAMMDRHEISSILSQAGEESAAPVASGEPSSSPGPSRPPLPELAAPANVPAHFNYYERHKQLAELQSAGSQPGPAANRTSAPTGTGLIYSSDELPALSVAPMSQQQFQALLRELKLCGAGSPSYLTTRDTNQQQQPFQKPASQLLSAKRLHQPGQQHQAAARGHLAAQAHLLGQMLPSGQRDELIHLHRSPNYCQAEPRHGFAGLSGRQCSPNPLHANACDRLCCGRGFETREIEQNRTCDCHFRYCCRIQCKTCSQRLVESACK